MPALINDIHKKGFHHGNLFELLILGMTLALPVLVQIARARDDERVVAINSAPLAGQGIHNVERLIMACEQADLPAPARKALSLLADQLIDTQKKFEDLTADIRADAKTNEDAQRLQTIPGIGPITASALVTALPDIADFKSGRDLSAWLGLTPRPHSSGGKERLGRISKMGNRYLRRLLYLGAIAEVSARRRGEVAEDWLSKIIEPKQAAIALANRMARTAYALMKSKTEFRVAQAA